MEALFRSYRLEERNRASLRLGLILVIPVLALLGCSFGAKPRVTAIPLDAEQLQVYGDFLDTFSALHFKRLANQTAPFKPSDLPESCAEGIALENQADAGRILHRFDPQVTKDRDLILVDPVDQATMLQRKESEARLNGDNSNEGRLKITEKISSESGFLVLTEIVFDKKHQFAVLKYLYFCGSHCKHGGTLVMEKVESSWTAKTRRPCTMIVN